MRVGCGARGRYGKAGTSSLGLTASELAAYLRPAAAQDAPSLYCAVIERMEQDYGGDVASPGDATHNGPDGGGGNVVDLVLALLAASRGGLHLHAELRPLLQKRGVEEGDYAHLLLVLEDEGLLRDCHGRRLRRDDSTFTCDTPCQ